MKKLLFLIWVNKGVDFQQVYTQGMYYRNSGDGFYVVAEQNGDTYDFFWDDWIYSISREKVHICRFIGETDAFVRPNSVPKSWETRRQFK